jgi:hypothetical protein
VAKMKKLSKRLEAQDTSLETRMRVGKVYAFVMNRWGKAVFRKDYPDNEEDVPNHPLVQYAERWRHLAYRLEGWAWFHQYGRAMD